MRARKERDRMPTTTIDDLTSDHRLQGHWLSRFIAGIIDGLLTGMVALVGCIPLFIIANLALVGWLSGTIFPLAWGLVYVAYSSVMESSRGSTLGKRMMNLRVMAIDGVMTFDKALKRNISKIYWVALLLDLIIGFFTEGDPRQRYLDRVAGTTVVFTEPAPTVPYTPQPPAPPQYTPSREEAPPVPPPAPAPSECAACGGRLINTGDSRRQCIRCGKVL
ncbi:MAG: RDD family protein [Methanobacteriota archaeon]